MYPRLESDKSNSIVEFFTILSDGFTENIFPSPILSKEISTGLKLTSRLLYSLILYLLIFNTL